MFIDDLLYQKLQYIKSHCMSDNAPDTLKAVL